MKGSSFKVSVANAYDEYLNPLTIDPMAMTWSVEGNVGEMDGATFTAMAGGTGKIIGEYDGVRAELPVSVVDYGDKPILLDSFDISSNWVSEAAKAEASIRGSSLSNGPYREGTDGLKLEYNFATPETGTKAAYAVAKTPISILGKPNHIGVWVFGDGNENWLRGVIVDGNGAKHTVDFTSLGDLNWTGWKYVTAEVPTDLVSPLKFERIYVTQPTAALQRKGQIYFDQLQAVYTADHEELIYNDVTKEHWAINSIQSLNTKGLIKGYPNGTFKPDEKITRAEAATIMVRELNLKKTKDLSFADVESNHFAYNEIMAAAENGIIIGRETEKFSPEGMLTRAEMATILTRAYRLTGTIELPFKDVQSEHWGYTYIQTITANKLVEGFGDNTFRPDQQITRAEFATFLDRVLKKS